MSDEDKKRLLDKMEKYMADTESWLQTIAVSVGITALVVGVLGIATITHYLKYGF